MSLFEDLRLAARYKNIKAGIAYNHMMRFGPVLTRYSYMLGFDTQRFTISASYFSKFDNTNAALNFCYRFGKYQDRVRWMN